MQLQVFTTGGTIDKIYFDALSEFQIGEPIVADMLQQMHVGFEYSVESLLRLDSLDMTDDHRRQIRQAVADSEADKILITHGTDGMVETAKWLTDISGKCIFLTAHPEASRRRTSQASSPQWSPRPKSSPGGSRKTPAPPQRLPCSPSP